MKREFEIKTFKSNSIIDSICCCFFFKCLFKHPPPPTPPTPIFTLLLFLHLTLPRLPFWTHTLYIKLSLSLDQQQLRAFLLVPLVEMVHLKYNSHSLKHVYQYSSTNVTFKKVVNILITIFFHYVISEYLPSSVMYLASSSCVRYPFPS